MLVSQAFRATELQRCGVSLGQFSRSPSQIRHFPVINRLINSKCQMQWHHKFTQAHQQHATWNVSTHRDGFIEGPKKDAFSIPASPGQCCAVCNSRVNLWTLFLLPPMLITAPTLQLQSRKSQQKALKRWHSFLRITATPYCCTRNGFQHKPEVRHSLWPSPAQGWACPTGHGCCTGTWVDTHSPGLFLHRALCRTQAAVLMMDIQTHRKICYPLKATFCMPCCYTLHDVPGT